MRIVLQRVSRASVEVDGAERGVIGRGLVALCGLITTDSEEDLSWCAEKVPVLRVFEDEQGKMNLSVRDVGGGILLIPNFTLAGDARQGRRPEFTMAMRPEQAEPAFARFVEMVQASGVPVATGVFRTHMLVSLINDGPVTLVLDSKERGK
jgi:D-tyrosyl-tRNA(Tyr) deacylase